MDLRLSWSAVCMLIAGMALCLSLPHSLNSEPHLSKAFGLFLIAGVGIAIGPFLLLYPLFLIGPNARVPHPHNLYLEVVASIGFPGYVAFWALLGAWGGMVWEILRRCRGNPDRRFCEGIGVGLAGGMVAHLVYSVTDAIALGEKAGLIFWAVLGLTAALWRLVRKRLQSV